jgi:membrane-associated protease RseP (regulator of RpoE activity)
MEYATRKPIHLVLFVLTIFSTAITGAFYLYKDPFASLDNLFAGFKFSFAILVILGCHEFGHYLCARKHGVYATLPYFIPFFLPFGTLGAFIKIKSPIPNKKVLFDIGVAGPLAGFIMSLIFLLIGFLQLPDTQGVINYVTQMHPWSETGEGAFTLGNSLLFNFVRIMTGGTHLPMYEVYHFPFIFAGWIGLLVTSLNLMPIGQLDGGHISYALIGTRAKGVAIAAFVLLALLNLYSTNWWLWTLLIFFVIRLKHPPTLHDDLSLNLGRKLLGWISYAIFIVSFSPNPMQL